MITEIRFDGIGTIVVPFRDFVSFAKAVIKRSRGHSFRLWFVLLDSALFSLSFSLSFPLFLSVSTLSRSTRGNDMPMPPYHFMLIKVLSLVLPQGYHRTAIHLIMQSLTSQQQFSPNAGAQVDIVVVNISDAAATNYCGFGAGSCGRGKNVYCLIQSYTNDI